MTLLSRFLQRLLPTRHADEAEDVWPADFRSSAPQRYSDNIHRYKGIQSTLRPKDLAQGFIHNEESNKRDMTRFFTFFLIYDQLRKENVTGDFAELGVYKGNTADVLARFARDMGGTAYLFDTFEGFNQKDITGIDGSIPLQFSDTSLETVQDFVGKDNTVYVKGYFPESVSQVPEDLRFSFVHLDCDLYSPMMSALEYFYPRMEEGGFILIHDYSSLHWDGAENAADEFFSDKPECLIPLPDSGGSAIVRKARFSDKFNNWRIRRLYESSVGEWVTPKDLKTYLKDGWYAGEVWGVWGAGKRHTMELIIPFRPVSDIRVIFDVDALLLGKQTSQAVTVFIGGTEVSKWTFSPEVSRGEREVLIPLGALQMASDGSAPATLALEFAPEVFERPSVLDPSNADTRQLGLALHRFKIEPVSHR